MKCPKRHPIIVRVHKKLIHGSRTTIEIKYREKLPTEESFWFAVPKRNVPPVVNRLVPGSMARDFREACLILEESPRMSAILSRRILADLLKEYAHCSQYKLASRIDAFMKDAGHPARHRENLHYLRELGDFSAHTMTDTEGNIIDVSQEEAAWTLEVVANLFKYFIVEPKKDAAMRAQIDAKLKQAGRKPINKLPKEAGTHSKTQEDKDTEDP